MSDVDSVITVDELDETAADLDTSPTEEQTPNKTHNESNGSRPSGVSRGYTDNYRSGGPGARPGQGGAFGSEIASKVLLIDGKKFYIDVKESRRGRFVKLSEVSLTGMKNRMTMEMAVAVEFHDKLTEFIDMYISLGSKDRQKMDGGGRGGGKLKSDTIFAGERRYYLDLKENGRGRFLKIAMTMPPPSFERADIVIPAQGMIEIRDALTDLLNEFGKTGSVTVTKSSTAAQVAPVKEEAGLSLKVDNKTFYVAVDVRHGTHLRISEVSPNFRTAVNIPQPIWNKFRKLLHSSTGGGSDAEVDNAEPCPIDED